jgi:hypothetical protein
VVGETSDRPAAALMFADTGFNVLFRTSISSGGITISGDRQPLYSANPDIWNGRFRLTNVKSIGSYSIGKSIVKASNFEEGFEQGINQALTARGVRPIGIELHESYFVLLVEPLRFDL